MLNKEEIEKAKEKTKSWINNMRTGRRANIIHKGDKDFCNDLETLLQYIDQLEQENKELKEIKGMKETIELAGMKIDDFYKAIRTYHQLEQENNKLSKMTDEMTLAIASYDIDEEICKNQVKAFCDNEPLGVTADVCAKCIKQYFEKKVESDKNGRK